MGLYLPFGFLVKVTEGFVDRDIVGAFEGKIVVIRETEGFVDGVFDGNTDRILHWRIVAPEIKILLSLQPVWSKVFHPMLTFFGMFILTNGVLWKAFEQ